MVGLVLVLLLHVSFSGSEAVVFILFGGSGVQTLSALVHLFS